ncbi:MAG TPA: AraC family transcriptional regulator [Thermoanaerobaculia bacterium]|nr:AraC family transcriptional regulator [Thermoanaerobaculia bacterium]
MAKIAVALKEAIRAKRERGEPGFATGRLLARGDGWRVSDVLCTSGPDDKPFEEKHDAVSIAIVAAGTFQYRTTSHRQLMSPGSLLLGHPGKSFECAHEHGTGDRCIAFHLDPDWFSRVTDHAPHFRLHRIPPLREFTPLIAAACAALDDADASWHELAIALAARVASVANDTPRHDASSRDTDARNAEARIARAVRILERHTDVALDTLARDAGLTPWHFLRTFTRVTGVTPHQFALRARLRNAALRLAQTDAKVIDVALDSGFGDVSNFTRTFRAEFGVTPRQYRVVAR